MTKTDWTAETTDRLRTIVEFVNGRCTNEEAGRKCLGFIMQYGESWLERIAADESAVPVGWTHELMWKNHESERVCKITRHAQDVHDFSTPLFTYPPVQPAQEQPGWKVPDDLKPLADEMEACWICASIGDGEITLETINSWSGRLAAMLAASPTPPKEK